MGLCFEDSIIIGQHDSLRETSDSCPKMMCASLLTGEVARERALSQEWGHGVCGPISATNFLCGLET